MNLLVSAFMVKYGYKDVLTMFDYLIIGSGIIGSAIARELSKYQLSLILVEKESDITNGQTIANSAIIHSGHDPKVGTLKAKLSVLGNKLYEELAKKLDFPLLETGALVVAYSEEEKAILSELYQRALVNGVVNPKLLDKEETLKLEPNLNENLLGSLSLPSTKTTVPWEASRAMIENAITNGLILELNHEVIGIKRTNDFYEVIFKNKPSIKTKHVINAAGLFSDEIMQMIEKDVIQIYPRRGEYYTLSHQSSGFVNHVIYPVPSSLGKGVLLTPQPDGHILIGPNAEDVPTKYHNETTKTGLRYIKEQSKKLSSKIPFQENIKNFAGLRAKTKLDDFYIEESNDNPGFYHLVGIDSPGLTAAPAIAKYLVDKILTKNPLVLKENFIEERQKLVLFHQDTIENKKKRYQEKPLYGEVICRCENITKQDIIDEINGLVPAETIKALKKRTRVTAGLCQGGYCESRVLEIISEVTKKPLDEINYYEEDTKILVKIEKVNQ